MIIFNNEHFIFYLSFQNSDNYQEFKVKMENVVNQRSTMSQQ